MVKGHCWGCMGVGTGEVGSLERWERGGAKDCYEAEKQDDSIEARGSPMFSPPPLRRSKQGIYTQWVEPYDS